MLEAGLKAGIALDKEGAYQNYQYYLNTFYKASAKVPNSPYPNLPDAPSIDVLDIEAITPTNSPSTKGYLVQKGQYLLVLIVLEVLVAQHSIG